MNFFLVLLQQLFFQLLFNLIVFNFHDVISIILPQLLIVHPLHVSGIIGWFAVSLVRVLPLFLRILIFIIIFIFK